MNFTYIVNPTHTPHPFALFTLSLGEGKGTWGEGRTLCEVPSQHGPAEGWAGALS
jgi:hypothetical protein